MRSPLTVALLLFAASALPGQDKPISSNVIVVTGKCPIGFLGHQAWPSSATVLSKNPLQNQQPNGAVESNSPVALTRPPEKAPHLDLSFDGSMASAKLLKVHVTVYGSPKGPHLMLVNTNPVNNDPVAESFELMTHAKIAATSFHSEIYPQTVGFVQWAEITQIDYADGSTWHPSAESACRVNFTGFKSILVNADH
jgi:hypothetical protein